MKYSNSMLMELVLLVTLLFVLAGNAAAIEVKLTDYLPYVEVDHNGKTVRIQRIQNQDHHLSGGFTKTSRKCPPFCIQPIQVSPEVLTVGEVEIFRFMEHELANGTGVIIDARTPSWYNKGTIPGSTNIPFTVFDSSDKDSLEMIEALESLGAVQRSDVGSVTRSYEQALAALGAFDAHQLTDEWDFTNAKDLLVWCNGPWCGQSPRAIKGLLEVGYPPEKIKYYRGGMQNWQVLGLTIVVPESSD